MQKSGIAFTVAILALVVAGGCVGEVTQGSGGTGGTSSSGQGGKLGRPAT